MIIPTSRSVTPLRLNPFSKGECPECSLQGASPALSLNDDDFWECPDCHLQAHTLIPGMLGVLERRGKGDLRGNPRQELSREARAVVCDFATFSERTISR